MKTTIKSGHTLFDITVEFLKQMTEKGYEIYMNLDRLSGSDYGYISKGDNFGYFQTDKYGRWQFSTVHKSQSGSGLGTGFGLSGIDYEPNPTEQNVLDSFAFAPDWVKRSDLSKIKKYKNIHDYIENGFMNKNLKKVEF